MKEDRGSYNELFDETWQIDTGEKGLFDDIGSSLIDNQNPHTVERIEYTVETEDDCEKETDGGGGFKKLVQYQTLGLSIVALLCGVFNLVEVIVNDRVSFPLLAVMFAIVGVWTTVASVIRKAQRLILLIGGICWLVFALAFAVLWVLNLCGVVK